MRFRCRVCGWIYDEDRQGQSFASLPGSYVCPVCGAPKSAFTAIEEKPAQKGAPTVAEKLIAQLAGFGVERIYGIPGDSNLPLIEALRKQRKIKFILTRNEATAAFAASAEAKLTGRLGVCLSIAGPGATNLITGLMDAATDRVPVLALTGQVSQSFVGSEALQEIDQVELFRTFCVFSESIAKPSQALRLLTLAVKKAYAYRGVAHLSLPTDVLAEPLDEELWQAERHLFSQTVSPDEEVIKKAAELIERSQRPVILAGFGTRHAREELLKLAERLKAPVATTSRAKGVIPETHPLALGVLGALGTEFAARAVSRADLLIVLGSAFRQASLVPEVAKVHCDLDASRIGKSFPVDVALPGDARLVLRELLKQVEPRDGDSEFLREIASLKEAYLREIAWDAQQVRKPIHPGFVIQTLRRHVSKDAIICVDVGDHTYWFYKRYLCEGEETLLSANLASMGFALPAAIAAKFSMPERQVVAITGDGGFAMCMADFTTAVANKLDITVILFNDGMLKNIKKEQEMYGYAEFGTRFINPDFAAFASSCGGLGIRVSEPEQLEIAVQEALASPKAALIDVLIDSEAMLLPVHSP